MKKIIFLILVLGVIGCGTLEQKDDLLRRIKKRQEAEIVEGDMHQLNKLPMVERLTYKVKYLGIPIATLVASIKGTELVAGRRAYVFEVVARTNKFFSKVFNVEDRYVSYMDVEHLYVLRHEESRREGNYKKDAIVDFDQINHKAYFRHLLNGEEKVFNVPHAVQDALSAVYYYRMLPLLVGAVNEFEVNVDEVNYEFLGVVEKKKMMVVPAVGKIEVFVMRPYGVLDGKMVKKGRMWGYFTADQRRIPVQAVIKTPIFGKATITLQKIE
ncbi:DUF3108 domain-containing protein [Candidatus Omnitrophota bacterium]